MINLYNWVIKKYIIIYKQYRYKDKTNIHKLIIHNKLCKIILLLIIIILIVVIVRIIIVILIIILIIKVI